MCFIFSFKNPTRCPFSMMPIDSGSHNDLVHACLYRDYIYTVGDKYFWST